MLTNGMRETSERTVVTKEVKPSSWKALMDYAYNEPIEVTSLEMALELIECSQRFEVDSFETKAVNAAKKFITEHNVCQLIQRSEDLNSAILRNAVLEVIHQKFHALCESESIGQLNLDLMITVLSSPDLRLRSELDVIHAIVWWMVGNGYVDLSDVTEVDTREARSEDLMRLVRHVSPEKMRSDDLKSAIPVCRVAGLRKLHDLCVVVVLISNVYRCDMLTSRDFVHRRTIPEAGFSCFMAAIEYHGNQNISSVSKMQRGFMKMPFIGLVSVILPSIEPLLLVR